MTTTQAISLNVLELVNSGMDVVDALKTVCGTETVDSMISELYASLRSAK